MQDFISIITSFCARIYGNRRSKRKTEKIIEELNKEDFIWRLGEKPDELVDKNDLIVISPSVPLNLPYAEKAKEQGKEVIAEIELAYRLCAAETVAITGTNGKTTTTTLTGEIFSAAKRGT
jgi:UDP-N-acetylmuramoylalanine--D-glutamate ligase